MTLPAPEEWPSDDPLGDRFRDLLRERAVATPDATALVDHDRDRALTYAEFDRRVDGRLAALRDAIGPPFGRVGCLMERRIAFAETYFAAARAGASLVPLNVQVPAETLEDQATRADVDAIVCSAETEATAVEIAPEGATVASVDEPDADGVVSAARRVVDRLESVEAGRDTERLVMFTSGTTGRPKGVRLTAGNLIASACGSAARLGVEPGDRWLVTLPMYHMGGLAPLLRSTLYGTTAVIEREFDAEATAATLAEREITGVSLVPTMLSRLLDAGWEPPSALRFVLLGGAPATPELLRRCEDRGIPVYPTYGLTETASQVATATPAEAFADPETVGRPLPNVDVAVIDGGQPCGPGRVGELVVDGPMVTPGYLDADQTERAFGESGFHTGDLGRRAADGRLYIVGRVDDQIVTGGENVHPASVAEAIRAIDGVVDAAVVGLPDPEWGERVAALVDAERESLTPADVERAVRGEIADFAVPKTIALTDELPRTASGTVDREAVRNRLREVADYPVDGDDSAGGDE